jgi:DNA-binding response OmpR family regulator
MTMGEQQHVLIVEDNYELGNLVAEVIQLSASHTTLLRDGQQALCWLAAHIPAIVVLDMHLPSVSGLQVLEHIRADTRLNDTKVLALTADAQLTKFLEATADATITKPFSVTELLTLVQRFLPKSN